MSRRSHDSAAHDKRMSQHRVTDDQLFNYVLRVAYLSHLTQAKPAPTPSTAASSARDKEYSSRLSGALSSSMISIGDLFKDIRDGSKSVKFPEKLVKALEQKLQDIAMARDATYSDQLTRRTMAVFYGQLTQEAFRKQIKENRKIEELILTFASMATPILKKEPSLAGDAWKVELNNQIWHFVKLIRGCLRNLHHVSPELISRLDGYESKLAPVQQTYSDSGYDSTSTAGNRDSVYTPQPSAASMLDIPMAQTVAKVFDVPEHLAQQELEQVKKVCTERAAVMDLKTCLKNVNSGMPFPGRREDFSSDEAWNHWKTSETTHLSQLILVMIKASPDLAKSMPSDSSYNSSPTAASPVAARPTSLFITSSSTPTSSRPLRGSISGRQSYFGSIDVVAEDVDADDEVPVGHHFTYIPPSPKKYYKRLLEVCLAADLEAMLSDAVNDDDEVSLGILSPAHIELVNECALRWRIGQAFRATCFLELVKQFYERNDVPLECIPEALQTIDRVQTENDVEKWMVSDSDYLATVYGSLFNIFLSALYHTMDHIPNIKSSEVTPYLSVLSQVRESGFLERFDVDISARISEVHERIQEVGVHAVEEKYSELSGIHPTNPALSLLYLTDEIEKTAKQLDKRFPEPLLGQLDLVSLVIEVQIPFFLSTLEQSRQRMWDQSIGPNADLPIQDVFALYRRTKTLFDMDKAFCPEHNLSFDLGAFFEPYVRQWLVTTDNKTAQWVQNAIAEDKFEAQGDQGHSTSIVDLFESLRSPISFLQELEWYDPYQEARFFTSLSKTISKAVEQYCRNIEELFMTEMFPRPADFIQPQKSSAWLEKAKQLAITEKKIEIFNFTTQSCVKLNNVEGARRLLDNMYNQMEADRISKIIEEHGPPVPEKQDRQRFLFTVKICIAEGLTAADGSALSKLDTFVTLSDEGGNRLAKTRTVYETLTPRWDETFDLSVEKPLWLMISIRDRALIGKHDTVGRAYICLDPRQFGDFLAKDLWMDLDTRGRILLRVSMEGEKDDVLFYFGRGFRSLKRAEGDMVRIFIDKMLPLFRQALSRETLSTLVKTGKGLDYNKALNNVTALYRSAVGATANDVLVPLPSTEKPRIKPEELTDVQIEEALSPLFDYFDANLPTLNTALSETTRDMVMTRIWKEILAVIEGLLIPPLSDAPSNMKPLSDKEVDIVFKWLKFLRDYFYIGGEGPMSSEALQNQKFRDVMSIRLYYDWHTDALMEECVRMMQQHLRAAPTIKKSKSVLSQRSLGTIKDRKREKGKEKEVSNGDTIMRILRMRPGTQEFIAQQLQILQQMQAEHQRRTQQTEERRNRRQRNGAAEIPPVPSIPE